MLQTSRLVRYAGLSWCNIAAGIRAIFCFLLLGCKRFPPVNQVLDSGFKLLKDLFCLLLRVCLDPELSWSFGGLELDIEAVSATRVLSAQAGRQPLHDNLKWKPL